MMVAVDPAVRPARQDDLAALVDALGQETHYVDRLDRQRRGLGVLLAAWLDGVPVGGVYLWQQDAEEPEIRECLPGVPLLNHLEVLPEWRNQGIGTKLLVEAERWIAATGADRVALAVTVDNPDAERLYRRLGYVRWCHPPVTCYSEEKAPHGPTIRVAETCYVLVKTLSAGTRVPRGLVAVAKRDRAASSGVRSRLYAVLRCLRQRLVSRRHAAR